MLEEQTFLIRELKNRLVTRSHVVSQEEETRSSQEVEKGIYLVQGNFEIAQEVETIFPEVGKVFTW